MVDITFEQRGQLSTAYTGLTQEAIEQARVVCDVIASELG